MHSIFLSFLKAEMIIVSTYPDTYIYHKAEAYNCQWVLLYVQVILVTLFLSLLECFIVFNLYFMSSHLQIIR